MMAFHVACPITCRRICYCKLGFPSELRTDKGTNDFLEAAARVEAIFKNPLLINGKPKTVQVLVPKVVIPPPPPTPIPAIVTPNVGAVVDGGGDAAEELLSSQNKRAAMQRKAAAASVAAEDYARRFESGDMAVGFTKDLSGDEQGLSNAKVMCRLCFSGENEGSDRARKMLSCKSCSKKYHRSCVKSWAQNRDLFHWSSWTCPSCRSCEVCRRTGDPNKLMFCKRCDGAYHCYCQQPPHKNVSSGPYLCPKHTKCHSCASTVPGNGLSVRWFLGYTCCDACGRLFVKGNYCPVCLKVYRDSESTPMVCCDVCQRWVHCHCDGISDEKYLQFQVDNNLQYRCATCRGECYQVSVRDHEDAVQELWRRRDKADRELTASLRAAAGLPTQEEIFSIQPYSDDDDNVPLSKNEYGRSLKVSLKGVVEKSPKKSKEYVKKSASKKYGKKKGFHAPVFGRTEPRIEGHSDAQSTGFIVGDNKDEDVQSYRSGELEMLPFPAAGSLADGLCSATQAMVPKNTFVNEVPVKTERISRDQMNSNRSHGADAVDESGKLADKSMNTKGPKLVIHLGTRNKNVASSPRSDASNLHREQELITSNGSDDMTIQRANDKHLERRDNTSKLSDMKGENLDYADQPKGLRLRGKEGNTIKIRKLNPDNSDVYNVGGGANLTDVQQSLPPMKARVSFGKRNTEKSDASDAFAIRGQKSSDDLNDGNKGPASVANSSEKELKPLLRLKFKNPYSDNQTSWAPAGEDDRSSVKGQRSKRKRPSPFMDKSSSVKEDEGVGHSYEDIVLMEIMDANWIIQKLGKDAIGKKVEVHQRTNNTWHKGTIIEVFEGTSIVSVTLDDGKTSNVDLSKQGIRFVSQKQRR
ncbi:uncharacterized protein LOC112522588 isoform X3 [Cynara cardunculus var. scolymus]|uniref:uncharacterized protein LOC112522588 isoform X3 n=1 Tax=Cynara cardunculus var. scolymus TaxID=59895 RepID=UPI000D623D30|nr:uncharacterized protein LOC112522588 isoform X3 [Cynara cardunculus var. scolymus]